MNAKEKAKEKANELIKKYQKLDIEIGDEYDGYLTMKIHDAKDCALILVEEILKCEATEPSDTDWDDCGATAQYYWPQKKIDAGKFWGDVKSELQSL